MAAVSMKIQIRNSEDADREAIHDVVLAAFGQDEGEVLVPLIDELSVDPTARPSLSLVAVRGERVVGHILFTNVTIEPAAQPVSASILAPLAVHPEFQSQGIGSRLITEGLTQLTGMESDLLFVLGDPDYYSRFGFDPAGVQGFEATYPIPEIHAAAWMVQELQPGVIGRVRGTVICADALNDRKFWLE